MAFLPQRTQRSWVGGEYAADPCANVVRPQHNRKDAINDTPLRPPRMPLGGLGLPFFRERSFLDCDLGGRILHLRGQRHRQLQNAVGERRLDVVRLYALWKLNRPRERPVVLLRPEPVALLVLELLLAL